MKKKDAHKGRVVAVYAAFPEQGALYSGAEGEIQGPFIQDGSDTGFVKITMFGSGDHIVAHPKQLRKV